MTSPSPPARSAWAGRPAAALAGLGLIGLAASAPAQEALRAIDTPGRAVFQVCRSWVMYDRCNEYGHVGVPSRIAVGDELFLEFGSNPKSMSFPVKLIRFANGVCTVFSEALGPDTDESKINKLTITPCRKPGS